MARKRTAKPRSFFEPWRPAKSTTHGTRPTVDGIPEEAAERILDGWERADKKAPWVLWGSRMAEPAVAKGYVSATAQSFSDERIIAVHQCQGLAEDAPTGEETCKRIAECVNALAGIADPVAFVAEVRALLLHYAVGENCEDPRTDVKVVSLLGRCIPLSELEAFGHAEQPAFD